MDDPQHLFINGLGLGRDAHGKWQVSVVRTNYGKFQVGPAENEKLDDNVIDEVCSYIRAQLEPVLLEFLQNEDESEPDVE